MRVRPATTGDADAIERVRIRGWQVAYRHVFPPDELDRLVVDGARWRGQLERPPAGWSVLVAERDGAVIGFAATGPSRDEEGLGELYGLYVDPSAWSTGAGRALIEAAEAGLAREYAEATLWVLEDNPRARRFYERAGWEPDGGRSLFERLGVSTPQLRYRKRLTSSRSRS